MGELTYLARHGTTAANRPEAILVPPDGNAALSAGISTRMRRTAGSFWLC